MVKIILLLFSFVVLAYFGISFFNRYKRKKLEKKLEDYQRLLEHARQTRLKYIRSLEKTENVKFQIDAIDTELASMKYRLMEFRLDLGNQLMELRRLHFSDLEFDSDLKIFEKKKVFFASTWKTADSLKSSFNAKLEEVKILHKSFAILSKESRGKTEIWYDEKRVVLKMYDELRLEVKINNPREVLLRDTRE